MKSIKEYINEAVNNYTFEFGFRVEYDGNFDAWQEWKKKIASENDINIEFDADDDYAYIIMKSDKKEDYDVVWKWIEDNAASTHGDGGAFVQYTDSKHHEVDINIDSIKNHKRL